VSDRDERKATSPNSDADAVRIVAGDAHGRRRVVIYQCLAMFLVACSAGYVMTPHSGPPTSSADSEPATKLPTDNASADVVRGEKTAEAVAVKAPAAPSTAATAAGRSMTARRAAPSVAPPPRAKAPEPEGDPTQDLSDFIPPGQAPTAGELIDELHKRGIYEGIGAFNPPGTSPPLGGLAVPDDFELPEGYVRHFQATDDGQRIGAILMFHPDYEFFDANGQPIAIPEDRVVPPELAPPGFPIRERVIPPPREP